MEPDNWRDAEPTDNDGKDKTRINVDSVAPREVRPVADQKS